MKIRVKKEQDAKRAVELSLVTEKEGKIRVKAYNELGDELGNVITIYPNGRMYRHRMTNNLLLEAFDTDDNNRVFEEHPI